MSKHTIIAIVLVVVGVLGVVIFRLVLPQIKQDYAYGTSDAKNLKGEVSIALDSWIGYFPLQSPVFKKLMREEGYKVKIIDDEANYPERMKNLAKSKVNFAVCTIDSYLIGGAREDFPATIIAIIDESKGGDAVVAWQDKIPNLDKLKELDNYRIAFTPDSPSDHLLKSIAVHFGIPLLLDKSGSWRIETMGAEDAYKKLLSKKADIAVIWEPYVTNSLSKKGIVKLLGTEDTEKLIIDILLVSRTYSKNNPDVAKLVVEKYFETQNIYKENPSILEEDIIRHTRDKAADVRSMLKGVRWVGFKENIQWFGISTSSSTYRDELITSINSTIKILLENEDFPSNPLPGEDPYTIINSSYVEYFYISGKFVGTDTLVAANPLEKEFTALTRAQWDKLKVVGSLKLRPITFRSGTAELDTSGELQLDMIVDNVKHYPNFRIIIEGHTGKRGDPEANRMLSQNRADKVKEYMVDYYNMDSERIFSKGMGNLKPLKRKDGESSRSYEDRLKRVEIYFVEAGI